MRNWSCILPNKNQLISTKNHLRKTLRTKRAAIDANTRQAAALSSMKQLADSAIFQNAQHIACYLAQGSEFDLQPIISLIWQTQKKCYLPVLTASDEKSLHFIAYESDDHLQTNCYGIAEPVFSPAKEIQAKALDLVLVPLIGFDLTGHRLGSGSGYYDRTFSFLLNKLRPKQPSFIGVGYQAQQLDGIPSDAWDVPLDGVLTEQSLQFSSNT
jgi:5-formyltetrahydrofolate cyclo-ligase